MGIFKNVKGNFFFLPRKNVVLTRSWYPSPFRACIYVSVSILFHNFVVSKVTPAILMLMSDTESFRSWYCFTEGK